MALKRELTLGDLVFYGVGIIFGAGIYVLIGHASGIAGNTIWLSFLIAAVVASFTGLSYAELSSMFPRDAAEYTFVKEALKDGAASFVTGWLTFATAVMAGATISLGFGKYAHYLTGINEIAAAAGLIIFFCGVNYLGIKSSSRVNIVLTSLTVLGLLVVILIGLPHLGSVDYFFSPTGIMGTVGAATIIFFAYLGFDDIVNVAEEAKSPKKNIPKAIIISIIITTVIYVLVALAAVSVVPWQDLGQSNTPLALVAATALGDSTDFILSVFALFATASTVLIFMLAASRMLFGMAEVNAMPKIFRNLHKTRKTPYAAIATIGIISMFFIFVADMKDIALVVDFSAFTIFAMINLSAFALRFSRPDAKRLFRVPVTIGKAPLFPLLGFLASCYMLLQFTTQTAWVVLIIIVAGYLFYKASKPTS